MSVDELTAAYASRPARSIAFRPRTSRRSSPSSARMMLSKDAMADVVEVVRGDDFYRPAHETIFDTAVKLYNSGDPVDAADRGRRTSAHRSDFPRRRSRVSPHPDCGGTLRSVGRVLRAAGARAVDPAHAWWRRARASPTWATTPTAPRWTTSSTARRPRSSPSPSAATPRTTSPVGDLIERTLDQIDAASKHDGTHARRPHGLPRTRRPHGRLPGRPDDRHRRPARHR